MRKNTGRGNVGAGTHEDVQTLDVAVDNGRVAGVKIKHTTSYIHDDSFGMFPRELLGT